MLPINIKLVSKEPSNELYKKIKFQINKPKKYNQVSVQFLKFPKKPTNRFNEIVINPEKKETIFKAFSREYNNHSISINKSKLQEQLGNSIYITKNNNSFSKLLSITPFKINHLKIQKSKLPIKYKIISNNDIKSFFLFPKKTLLSPITLYNDLSKKTRNKIQENNKKELTNRENHISLVNDFNKKNQNKNLIKIPIINKSKSEIFCHSKKNNLQLCNTLYDLIQIKDIEKYIKTNYIPFPLNKNINNTINTFYYAVNQMYFSQLSYYFKHRINWVLVSSKDDPNYNKANFEWRYYSNRISFKRFIYNKNSNIKKLKMTNLFEKNYELGNKKHFFINLVKYCDKYKLNVFEIVPFTIIFSHSTTIFDEQFLIFKNIFNIVKENLKSKENLIFNKQYSEVFKYEKNFLNLKNTPLYISKEFLSEYNYWIIKPSDLYQGKCIEINNDCNEIYKLCKKMFQGIDMRLIINNVNEIMEKKDNENEKNNDNNKENDNEKEILNIQNNEIKEKEEIKIKRYSTMHCSNDIIIQKYLDNPLLYYNRKFDIRCFVLIDSNYNVFYCKEGHLKGSSEEYDLNNKNKFIHITNHSIQKKSNNFEKYEFGNEISYNDFKEYIKKENISLEKFDKLINDMKDLIIISMNSVKDKLKKINNVLCFEIFGYDFIIDKNFKPWILEINNNPGLGISSPLIEKLIPRMLDDAFRLTIDKVFETKYENNCFINGEYFSKFKLDGFSDNENIFEFLCNISV